MFDVITFGSATYDVFIRSSTLEITEDNKTNKSETCLPLGAKIDIEELDFDTGGGATNAAATFARMGFKTATVCSVGNDINGQEVINALKEEGVSLKLVQKNKKDRTGYSVIILSGGGERTILVHRGASQKIDTDCLSWSKIKAKWFYVTSLGGNLSLAKKIFEQAEKIGAHVFWNPGNQELETGLDNLKPLIQQVDILNLNLEEAMLLSKSERNISNVFKILQELPKMSLLITDGQNGAYASNKKTVWHCSSLNVPVVNTTGAGDAFGSGFVTGLIKDHQNSNLNYALSIGMLNAAGTIQNMGAKRGLLNRLPNQNELEKIKIEKIN